MDAAMAASQASLTYNGTAGGGIYLCICEVRLLFPLPPCRRLRAPATYYLCKVIEVRSRNDTKSNIAVPSVTWKACALRRGRGARRTSSMIYHLTACTITCRVPWRNMCRYYRGPRSCVCHTSRTNPSFSPSWKSVERVVQRTARLPVTYSVHTNSTIYSRVNMLI